MTVDEKIKEVVRELCRVAFKYAPEDVLKELARKLNTIIDG